MKQAIPVSNSISFDLLFSFFPKITKPSLWVLDENPPSQCPAANQHITVITNRFDTAQEMRKKGFDTFFSDFNFSELPHNQFECIFYRISKEKALTHYIMNQASQLLTDNGCFIFSGAKSEGIKGYIDRSKQLFNNVVSNKADKLHWLAKCSIPSNNTLLDDKDYPRIQSVTFKNKEDVFLSKPGVFGWNKIDNGSELLIEQLPNILIKRKKPNKVLDIGCGYGYLTVKCAGQLSSEFTACDNNAAAVSACKENFKANNIKGEVIATNCTQDISEFFELILCNPPFHNGFGVHNDLTSKFLEGASKQLSADGIAVFVVNLHIPLERKANHYFNRVNTIFSDAHFKVITLEK